MQCYLGSVKVSLQTDVITISNCVPEVLLSGKNIGHRTPQGRQVTNTFLLTTAMKLSKCRYLNFEK